MEKEINSKAKVLEIAQLAWTFIWLPIEWAVQILKLILGYGKKAIALMILLAIVALAAIGGLSLTKGAVQVEIGQNYVPDLKIGKVIEEPKPVKFDWKSPSTWF